MSVLAGESVKLECAATIDPLLEHTADYTWIKVNIFICIFFFFALNLTFKYLTNM